MSDITISTSSAASAPRVSSAVSATDSSLTSGKLRGDLLHIVDLIVPKSRVLDLGCGDGALLAYLRAQRDCTVRGLELDPEEVIAAMSKRISVIRADLDDGLSVYGDDTFDVVVLSLALMQVKSPAALMREMLRVGSKAIVSYPNFAHSTVRNYLFFRGRMPVSSAIPYSWHDTPNIHHTTIPDFRDFARECGGEVTDEIYLRSNSDGERFALTFMPHLRAETVIAVVEKR